MIRSSRCGEARPVRTVASSPRVESTDLAIRSLASTSSSSISSTGFPSSSVGGGTRDQRPHFFAANDPIYVALVAHVEDVDRQIVVHAEGERGRVHHLQTPLDRFLVGDRRD